MVTISEPRRSTWPVALVIAVLACALLVWALKSIGGDTDAHEKVDLKSLRASTTETTVKGAPRDRAPQQAPGGVIVHPKRTVPLFDAPGGNAFAKLHPEHFGDAWFPVIGREAGWVRVLLPSRPNGATGWIRNSAVESRRTAAVVRVHTTSRSLEVVESGVTTGTWTVAVGAPDTPTPTGRTFLLGQLVDDQQSFSPVILPLGTHSKTLDSYGGGPGTVAIHGWTDSSVFGQAVSHGCVRVPDDALDRIRALPLGTPVLIDDA